jgi:hypothetical protein
MIDPGNLVRYLFDGLDKAAKRFVVGVFVCVAVVLGAGIAIGYGCSRHAAIKAAAQQHK